MKRAFTFALLLLLLGDSAGHSGDRPRAPAKLIRTLIVGGGTEHDFDRWFNQADAGTLKATGRFLLDYTEKPEAILPALPELDVLVLANNQPLTDPAVRKEILAFANSGKGLVLLHPTLGYNWPDWPEFYRVLVGGEARAHDKLDAFEVTVLEERHPVMTKVPGSFKVTDELQRFEPEPKDTAIQVLATGEEPGTGKIFPVVWTVKHAKARIVCISLGHDSAAHGNTAYQTILRNSLLWVSRKK
jgi:type 1 glutamine amidotransferase